MAREYTPERMVIAAAGAVEHDAFVAAADRFFGARAASSAQADGAAPTYTGGDCRIPRKLEQVNLVIGLPGTSFKDERYNAIHMFAQIVGGGLTSRLWHEVRERRGLAYEIGAFHWPFSDTGLFGISAGTAAADASELVEVTLDCARGAVADIDETEVARAKTQLKVALLAALETPGGRIERNARQLLAWGRVIPTDEILAKVDRVTVAEVREAGAGVLAGAPTFAAIGPVKKVPSLARLTEKLQA
jgi:predicted Zn-dependent peptidase